MSQPAEKIDVLQAILTRNSGNGEDVDLRENEVDHYFYFDKIHDASDRESAWAVFPEEKEIRRRLEQVEQAAHVIGGFGYRVPNPANRCESNALADLVRRHIQLMQPLILNAEYNREVLEFIDRKFQVLPGAREVLVPSPRDNPLFLTLYEGLQEFKLKHFPLAEKHYLLLCNWAEYLTRCDEVALHLLWPCLRDIGDKSAQIPEPGFRLWTCQCRDRYWIKDSDFKSGVVYYRPPWLD
jgi:hypothetical protein